MATTTTRRINVYVNTGDSGKSLKELEEAMKRDAQALEELDKGTEEYSKALKRLSKNQGRYERLSKELDKLTENGEDLEGLSKEMERLQKSLANPDLGNDERIQQIKQLETVQEKYKRLDRIVNGTSVREVQSIKDAYKERRILKNQIESGTLAAEEYERAVRDYKKLDAVIQDHRDELYGVEKGYDSIKVSAVGMAGVLGGAFATDSIIQFGKRLFDMGVQMDSVERKAEIVFGETLPKVNNAAREHAAVMGLTNSQYKEAVTNIGDLLIPMGFQRDEAANMSVELTNLSGALSEWTGGQRSAKEVSEVLAKALLGEREQLKELGISIKEADVKRRLSAKGLDGLTGKTLEQAKAAATLELITEKSVDAQTSFAENTDTLVRKKAELIAKITTIAEKISTVLIPVFDRLLTYVGNLTDAFLVFTEEFQSVREEAEKATASYEKNREKAKELEDQLRPLIEEHDNLAGQSDLTKQEQDRLRTVITQIADIVPTAVTEFDEYGKAMEVSTKRAKALIKAQRAIARERNATAIEKQKDALNDLNSSIQSIQSTLGRQDEEGVFRLRQQTGGRIPGAGAFADFPQRKVKEYLTEEEVRTLQGRLKDLQNSADQTKLTLDALGADIDISDIDTGDPGDDPRVKYSEKVLAELKKLADEGDKKAEEEIKSRIEAITEYTELGTQELKILAEFNDEQAQEEIERRRELAEDRKEQRQEELEELQEQLEKEKQALIDAYEGAQEAVDQLEGESFLESLTPEEREIQEIRSKYSEVFQEIVDAEIQFREKLGELQLQALEDPDNKELQQEIKYYEELYNNLTNRRLDLEEQMRKEIEEKRAQQAREAGEAIDQDLQETGDQQAEETAAGFEEENQEFEKFKPAIDRVFGPEQSDLDKELEKINDFYDEWQTYAKGNAEAQKKIEADRQKELFKARLAHFQQQADVIKGNIGQIADDIGQIYQATGEKHQALLVFQKALTGVQIAIDTASAISSIIRAATTAPNLLVAISGIATGVATVITNIAKAKQLLSGAEVPAAPQKKEGGYYDHDAAYGSRKRSTSGGRNVGGYYDVIGQDDGKKYRARYIHEKKTGMLPDRPVVLASEAGREYFVSNESLRNPAVIEHVRAIENIQRYGTDEKRRIPQFQEGGPTTQEDLSSGSSPQTDLDRSDQEDVSREELITVLSGMKSTIDTLNAILRGGIQAKYSDEELIQNEQKLQELNEASGNAIR